MKNSKQSGFALVATMIMMSVLLALVGAYSLLSRIEQLSTRATVQGTRGFFAAEGGLNARADEIRQLFVGYNVPTGTSPSTSSPVCIGSNKGSGDFICKPYELGNSTSTTYINADPSNPILSTIPVGERYQNLTAQEYRYTATSESKGGDGRTEAKLQLRFKSRLVPIFQFAAFYNKDLEILPGPAMTLSGPVHTNGDLYLNAETSLAISGQVTTAGDLYRGRKNDNTCRSKPVSVKDPTTAKNILLTCPTRTKMTAAGLTAWNGMIQTSVPIVTVPAPEDFDPIPGNLYFTKADLRLVLHLNSSNSLDTTYATSGVEVRNSSDAVDTTLTGKVNNKTLCPGSIEETTSGALNGWAVKSSYTFTNKRENKIIRMLEIDTIALLNCIHSQSLFGGGKTLSDSSEGGIVLYVTVDGPNEGASANNYGIRFRRSSNLRSTISGAPIPKGLTIVSDQAVYIAGNFNSTNKIPAAVMSDSLNVLSSAWMASSSGWTDSASAGSLSGRVAANTTINAAFLSGTDTTGNQEGVAGQGGAYNGGLENYPRFHENWSGKTMTYRGSFVSLGKVRHVSGTWANQSYNPPARDWNYDTSFNNAANLPPITPRFVYLRQQLFLRDYQLGS